MPKGKGGFTKIGLYADLNNCILPNLKFSPNKLLLGIMINTKRTPADQTEEEVSTNEVEVQMAYVEQQ
jgi:hypothetical protein